MFSGLLFVFFLAILDSRSYGQISTVIGDVFAYNNVNNCNYCDKDPIWDPQCLRIRITGIKVDMDGYLSFEGFGRNETNSLNRLIVFR